MLPKIGDMILVERGRLMGRCGRVEMVNSHAIGFRCDDTDRLRWVSIERVGDLRIEEENRA